MEHDDLAFAGAARQADMIRRGEVSSRELVELYLGRIERLEPELNAFRVVTGERALIDAQQADSRHAAGDERPLLGVPLAVKDTEDLAGEVTTWGTAAHGGPAQRDNDFVGRLRAAGAVILGKTNLPELAIMGSTEGLAFGVTRNPWNAERAPGGSSGGSAAAVAAGLCAAATGSDGAGSIRIPAALCGLFGLKPQRDRISLAPFREHWHGLSVAGSLTRSVADSALWLDVCHGGVANGPPAPEQTFALAARTRPGALRIAYSTKPPLLMAPPIIRESVKAAVEETAGVLRSLGHTVDARDPDWGLIGNHVVPRYLNGVTEEAARVPHPERLESRTRGFARLGRLQGGRFLRNARRSEARDARRILSIFDRCDVLVMPTVGEPAVEVGRWAGKGAIRTVLGMSRAYPYCAPWNHLGNPAASVPAGFTPGGTPLAVQLVGRPNDEATLLSLAAQLESERPWADRQPPAS